MKRLTPKLLEEARKMRKAWIQGGEEKDEDWILREISSLLGVSLKALIRKI